jgi:hypothetical protein
MCDKTVLPTKLQLQQIPEKPFHLANLLYGLLTLHVRLLTLVVQTIQTLMSHVQTTYVTYTNCTDC